MEIYFATEMRVTRLEKKAPTITTLHVQTEKCCNNNGDLILPPSLHQS